MKPMMFVIGLLLCAAVHAGEAAPSSKEKDDVLEAIRARLAASARNDTQAWARFVADDMIAPLEGDTPSKAAWLGMHAAWPREVEYKYGPLQDPKVRIHGDTAVAVYHAQQLTTIGGQTTSVHKWQIETLMRREGRWILVGVADGLIPPEPVAIKVDAAILDTYVGDYEWAPTMISKIRRHGDALTEETAGQGKSDLAAENATTFFFPGEAAGGDSSRVIFVKDEKGRVTQYIYRELGATDRIVKKIR